MHRPATDANTTSSYLHCYFAHQHFDADAGQCNAGGDRCARFHLNFDASAHPHTNANFDPHANPCSYRHSDFYLDSDPSS